MDTELGYYTFREAAKLANFEVRHGQGAPQWRTACQLRPSRIRGWFRSRKPYFNADWRRRRITDDIPDGISFHALLDAVVTARILCAGTPIREVLGAHRTLEELLDTQHPFAHSGVTTDGRHVYRELPSAHFDLAPRGRAHDRARARNDSVDTVCNDGVIASGVW